jgi:ribulose-phosphate 3-epimerase
MIKIAPSILSADFACLGEQVRAAEAGGADLIHVDVMDGHFVPNITVGPLVVKAIKPYTCLPLDVHLMIQHPEQYIRTFADAGADLLTVHVETTVHLHRLIHQIRDLKVRVGVALNPATPIECLSEVLSDLDLVLVMTVNPGFGGQQFIRSGLSKIARLRQWIDETNPAIELQVDGGINLCTAPEVAQAGADILVAGSAIYESPLGIEHAVYQLRQAAQEAQPEK